MTFSDLLFVYFPAFEFQMFWLKISWKKLKKTLKCLYFVAWKCFGGYTNNFILIQDKFMMILSNTIKLMVRATLILITKIFYLNFITTR